MSQETYVCYWIGQEPTPPSITLDRTPAAVDVVPLAFVTIDAPARGPWALDFDFLCHGRPPALIQQWIGNVRSRGTKVVFSINDSNLGKIPDIPQFVDEVVKQAVAWGVDGVDLDYEPVPFVTSQTLIDFTRALRPALRTALRREPVIVAPVFGPWGGHPQFLRDFAQQLDYVTTMDYTPYPGYDSTIRSVEQYMRIIGDPGKVAIGVSCMGPPPPDGRSPYYDLTPIDDVMKLCHWEPANGRKRGIMLYTSSYDLRVRPLSQPPPSGTNLPDGTFMATIARELP